MNNRCIDHRNECDGKCYRCCPAMTHDPSKATDNCLICGQYLTIYPHNESEVAVNDTSEE